MEDECKSLDYDKNHILGRGGFAIVYRGKLVKNNGDDGQKADVAIKRIQKNLKHHNYETISMEREFIIQKKLNHPNIVKLLHIEQDENFLYFALELCEASLDRVFKPENDPKKYKGPLPTDIDFMLQLSHGLQYIHSENLVHRDIKPGNVLIFIQSTGEVVMKWSDFGLSKETSKGEYSMSGYRGTQPYMAPEILALGENDQPFKQKESDDDAALSKKKKLTNMSDVFSCALVFFKYFTKGYHPFGNNEEEITSNIRLSNPVNLRKLPKNHFAFKSIKKMLSNHIQGRPKLREIILLLSCLQRATKVNPLRPTDDVFRELTQKHQELCDLCSIPDAGEQHIAKLTRIVNEDTIGLVNLVDEEGYSPLLLACGSKKIPDLLLWVQVMTTKERIRDGADGTNSEKNLDGMIIYQNSREDINVLNRVLVNYEGAQCQEITNRIVKHHLHNEMMGGNNIDFLVSPFPKLFPSPNFGKKLFDFAHKFLNSTEFDQICLNTRHLKDLVKCFIENGMDLTSAKTYDGFTILHHLCNLCYIDKDLIDVVELLIENGVDVNAKDSTGFTALLYLIQFPSHENLIESIRLLIELGADVTVRTPNDNWTALHFLCRHYHHSNLIDLVRLLIDNGVDINAKRSPDGATALHLLCHYCPDDILMDAFKFFINSGVSLNACVQVSDGYKHYNVLWFLLQFKCKYPKLIDLVELLIENGLLVDRQSLKPLGFLLLNNENVHNHITNGNLIYLVQLLTPNGLTALHSLCLFYDHTNLIDFLPSLIERGIVINAKTPMDGQTALHLLCRRYSHDDLIHIFEWLIENSADVNAKDFKGLTALHCLCFFYKHENLINLVQLLIDRGADINAKTVNGSTALHLLCLIYKHENIIDLVELLVDRGVDVNARTEDGMTAISFLCQTYSHSNIIEVLRLFIDKGADLRVHMRDPNSNRDEVEATALYSLFVNSAQWHNLPNIVRFLIERGIDVTTKSSEGRNPLNVLRSTVSDPKLLETYSNFYKSKFCPSAENNEIVSELVEYLSGNHGNSLGNNLLNIIQFLNGKGIDVVRKSPESLTDVLNILNSMNKTIDDPEFMDMYSTLNEDKVSPIRAENTAEINYDLVEILSESHETSHGNLINLVRLLTENGIDVKLIDCEGLANLYFTFGNYTNDNLIDLIKFLIDENEFDIKSTTSDGWTALHFLCRYYSDEKLVDIFKWMITKDVDFTLKLPDGRNVLHLLCQYYKQENLIDLIKILFQNGIHVDQSDDGWNALNLLCEFYDKDNLIELIELLIDNGVYINKKASDGWTALHFLCQNYPHENLFGIIKILIKNGIEVDAKISAVTPFGEMTALHLLCQFYSHNNLIELVRLLIDNGADVNAKNLHGETALMLLCHHYTFDNLIELVRLLIAHGVDLNAKHINGSFSAFHILCQRYRHGNLVDLVELMICGGVDATARALENGVTALHLLCTNKAQRSHLINIVKIFVRKGIDVTLKDFNRMTALDVLRKTWKHGEIDPYLIELLSEQNRSSEKRENAQIMQTLAEIGIDLEVNINELDGMMAVLEEICTNIPTREDLWKLIRSFELLIEEGSFDINAKHSNGMTALHIFIQQYPHDNLIDLLRYMIVEKGADVSSKNSYGATAIHFVLRSYRHENLIEVAQLLIEHGGDIVANTSEKLNAFYLLCLNKADHHELNDFRNIVRWLIRNGVDVNQQSSDGSTAFHLLCQDNSNDSSFFELVRFLIEEGVDVTIKTSEGYTALHYLCECYVHSDLINLARLMIEKGTDVNAKTASDGCTALHYLCKFYVHDNLIDLIRLFIENDADIKSKNSDGWTALHILCRYYNHDNLIHMVRLLVENGIDITAKIDAVGATALSCLCENYKHENLIELVQSLIGEGVDINARDPDGWTALYNVCRFYTHKNLIDVVKLLIAKGADVNAKDSDGLTALYFLCRFYTQDNLIDIVQLLIGKGADVNVKDSDELTALDFVTANFLRHEYLFDVFKLLAHLADKAD